MSELKACPFCGSDKISSGEALGKDQKTGELQHQTGCLNCDAFGPAGKTVEEADERWNERAGARAVNIQITPVSWETKRIVSAMWWSVFWVNHTIKMRAKIHEVVNMQEMLWEVER